MGNFFEQFWQIITTLFDPRNLTNPDAFKAALNQPGVFPAAFAAVALIVFTETGLFFGFLLPGDSLLVVVGLVAKQGDWPIQYLIPALILAAIVGDSVGYLIGKKMGPRLFQKEDSFFFRKKYIRMAQEFYERHGGKTIMLAKFVPFIRTFAPVVAGMGQMAYKRFLLFSVMGATLWIPSMIMLGYTLQLWLDPLLKKIFGKEVDVAKHVDKLILTVIAISVLPIFIKWFKNWRASRQNPSKTEPATTIETTTAKQ
jgi:membrane-associated protein